MNRWVGVGRTTKDPVLKKTQNDKSVVSFILACDRTFKQDGQPKADFINCVAWNKTADAIAQYVKKGSLIGVEGRIQTRSYDDKDGRRVFITEVLVDYVQFLGNGKQDNASKSNVTNDVQDQENTESDDLPEIDDDSLPF